MPTVHEQLRSVLLPRPEQARASAGTFQLRESTRIEFNAAAAEAAQVAVRLLQPATGFDFAGGEPSNRIVLQLDPAITATLNEAFWLSVTPEQIQIKAKSHAGLIWGIQTLRQLLPPAIYSPEPVSGVEWLIPSCVIDDAPAFGWRGMMLDCARHFMPIEFIYKWIDLLSAHKLNVFHWHLTDDQGWRIEIKKYPKLTEIGAWRKQTLVGHALPKRDYDTFDGTPHGGFYMQEQIRQVVAYAAARGVTVVPEIEMPGHAQAAIAAYPELGNLDTPLEVWTVWGINPNIVNVGDATIQFFKDVLDEVMELFPSPFIHIGGDEAPKNQWKASPSAQAKMKSLGLANEDELQSWFIRQIDAHLMARGRRMIGWDEILEGGLAPGATVMSWRGEDGGVAAAKAGHDVIMTPWQKVYFDHYQTADRTTEPLAISGCTTLKDVFEYQPVPAALEFAERKHVLGGQANLWTEYVLDPAHAEYMAYPRACALAEVLWSGGGRDWSGFQQRLAVHLRRLEQMKVNYHRG